MSDLLKHLPPIRRARDWHLYDHKGERYLDLWQEDGAYHWGHRPESLYLTMKDLLSPGLAGHFPTIYGPHLNRTLQGLFLGRFPQVFRNRERAEKFCLDQLKEPPVEWRPFTPFPKDAPGVIPLLPYGPLQLRPVLTLADFKSGDLVSGMESGALNKLLGSWPAYLTRVNSEKWETTKWKLWEVASWTATGPLLWAPQSVDYERLFHYFLKKKIIISPVPEVPSWIPGEFSPGELQGFIRASAEAPWTF